jgi:hypothetical protein
VHRSLWISGSLLALTLAVFASSVSATTLTPLSDQELADRADVIVIGRATGRQVKWFGQDLATMVTVAVGESLKGVAGTTLTVALPGGSIGIGRSRWRCSTWARPRSQPAKRSCCS